MSVALVVAETRRGEIRDVSFELITAARSLNAQGGTRVVVGMASRHAETAASALNVAGVDEIVSITTPSEHYEAHVAERALEALIDDVQPDVVLLPHSVDAFGYGPAVAAKAQLGFVADAVAVKFDDGRLVARRRVYGERLVARIDFPDHERILVQVRPGAYDVAAGLGSATCRELNVDFDASRTATEHVEFLETEVGEVDITRAEFLLSLGRGVEDRNQLERFDRLAASLGATLSVSRPLVDAGWAPPSRQVGQSGQTVKPKVYLALGISGAVQHLAGMSKADTIIAVNTDPDAPIFGVAHYGAVIDLHELADELEHTLG
jgi:electron transfer flavoprotein alpha subunit